MEGKERGVWAIYCDDIRHEQGNKRSYMGVYSGVMFVPQVPIVIPRLCLIVSVTTPIKRPFKYIKVKVAMGDEQISESVVAETDMARIFRDVAKQKGPVTLEHVKLEAEVAISPLKVEKESSLKIRVETDEGEIKGPSLLISVARQEHAPQEATK
jgi:hypothetical protein